MSLLEGGRDHRQVYPAPSPYGEIVPQSAFLPLVGAMDVAVDETGKTAFAAGNGILYAIDLSNPQKPTVIGELPGVRTGRQVEVSHGIAAVTSRADGVFFCDISDARHPKILSHYDAVELATGVCISGNLCCIACRHYGVEIVDITHPAKPVHCSSVLAGEAQSVAIDGKTMYAGAWMEREIRIFDISDPAAPRLISRCELDGFGDGVCIRDGVCYAATGHHARRFVNRRKFLNYDFVTEQMLHEGYGGGHGLEIFDVSNPGRPVRLSRIKTPPLFMSGYDLWDVTVSGDHAFLADTFNGLFIINIADPGHPFFTGYRRLEPMQNPQYRHEPPIQQLCCPVTGLALTDGYVLACGAMTGLHVLQTPYAAQVPPRAPAVRPAARGSKQKNRSAFRTDGQIHGLAFVQDTPVVAAGGRGMVVLDPQNAYAPLDNLQCEGTAIDIRTDGRFLYLAEGLGGFSVWRTGAGKPSLVGRLSCDELGDSVRQVVLLGRTDTAALQLGTKKIAFINIGDPANPEIIKTFEIDGTMYYKNIVDGLLFGKYAAAVPLSPGIAWFEIGDTVRRMAMNTQTECQICPVEEGVCFGRDGFFSIFRGKYLYSQSIGAAPLESQAICVCDSAGRELYLSGKPVLLGDVLFLLNRQNGRITVLNVANPLCPVFCTAYQMEGNPEQITAHQGRYWVCCGHDGLYNDWK